MNLVNESGGGPRPKDEFRVELVCKIMLAMKRKKLIKR